jgi:cytochrome oxidase Cu insertion factor (SCO1/SenC/PrrC family)
MAKRSLALVAVLLALAGSVGADQQERPAKAEKGKLAPDLKVDDKSWLNTKDGKALKLDDLKGKVVLIDFWGVW